MTTPTYRTAEFDFELPAALIAQSPNERRDASRLMIVHRESGHIEHAHFTDLPGLMPPGDAIVLNTTRVIRARLLGRRHSGAPAEVLLLKPLGGNQWEAMVQPGSKLKPGRVVHVAPGFDVEILASTDRGTRRVQLVADVPVEEAIDRHGHIPLPPYITRADAAADVERYQTVYARERGSVAAPTAGLHFTPDVLRALAERGIRRAEVVLHVGAGTFKPVDVEDVTQHRMHEEWYRVPAETATTLNATRAAGGKVWAVGTTSVRTLESHADERGHLEAGEGDTDIFIYPPYQWRAVDRIVTNFHLPRSTLLMLVAAFAGYDLTMEAYRVAVREGYRFFSYGDAMVIL
ncbi:MAG: tRNA preQ1(34) S-adenosylmethionine ribosyltransferase-isomerase QueA [Gemmatimonadaceae bacterium]